MNAKKHFLFKLDRLHLDSSLFGEKECVRNKSLFRTSAHIRGQIISDGKFLFLFICAFTRYLKRNPMMVQKLKKNLVKMKINNVSSKKYTIHFASRETFAYLCS